MKLKYFISVLTVFLFAAHLSAQEPEKLTFTTKRGKEYKNATITQVCPDSILITHSSGAARVAYEDLPDDIAKRFNFNPQSASAERKFRAQQERAWDEQSRTTPQTAEGKQGSDDALAANAKRQIYKIASIVRGEGALANEFTPGGAPGDLARSTNTLFGRSTEMIPPVTGDLVFLHGEVSPSLVDDMLITAAVVPDGTYQYTTVLGATSTVRKFKVLKMAPYRR